MVIIFLYFLGLSTSLFIVLELTTLGDLFPFWNCVYLPNTKSNFFYLLSNSSMIFKWFLLQLHLPLCQISTHGSPFQQLTHRPSRKYHQNRISIFLTKFLTFSNICFPLYLLLLQLLRSIEKNPHKIFTFSDLLPLFIHHYLIILTYSFQRLQTVSSTFRNTPNSTHFPMIKVVNMIYLNILLSTSK